MTHEIRKVSKGTLKD